MPEPLDPPDPADAPMVIAVIDDLAGNAGGKPWVDLRERKLEDVDLNMLDAKVSDVSPGLAYTVPSMLPAGMHARATVDVELRFEAMRDFEPARVARSIAPVGRLLELREMLSALARRSRVDAEFRRRLAAELDALAD